MQITRQKLHLALQKGDTGRGLQNESPSSPKTPAGQQSARDSVEISDEARILAESSTEKKEESQKTERTFVSDTLSDRLDPTNSEDAVAKRLQELRERLEEINQEINEVNQRKDITPEEKDMLLKPLQMEKETIFKEIELLMNPKKYM